MNKMNAFIEKLSPLKVALLAGFVLVLGWSPLPTFPLLFVGIFLLLVLSEKLENESNRRFVWLFYIAHFIWNIGTTWWVYKASLGGAIYMIFANSLLQITPWVLHRFTRSVLGSSKSLILFICFYIGFEHFHHVWDLSWPWLTLGNSLGSAPIFAQFYEFTGVAGGSIWILLGGLALYSKWAKLKFMHPLIAIMVPAVISLFIFFIRDFDRGEPIQVGLVQPNFEPHDAKFDIDPLLQLDTMLQQMEKLAQQGATLMVLPETALVGGIDESIPSKDRKFYRLERFIEKHPGIAIMGGCDSYRIYSEKATATARQSRYDENMFYDQYNTGFYIDSLNLRPLYHKAKLVPGTEIMPYPGVFSFLDKVMISLDGTVNSLGRDYITLNYYSGDSIAFTPSICYESIYGDWTAKFVRDGGNIISIMSNDGWWGQTYGYKQLLQYGQLRAIENRRWIARSGNTGISGVISPKGMLSKASTFWTRDAILATVYPRTELTMYTILGDYINRILFLVCLFVIPSVIVKWYVNRKNKTKT